jgi:Icc protein
MPNPGQGNTMIEPIRVVQLTDCHLSANPGLNYRGVNPHESLQALLPKAGQFKPDLILATGDLSEDSSPESYAALYQYLNPLSVPVLALPGNHDDALLLQKVFPGSPVDTVEVSQHGHWQIIRLNSCLQGEPHGRFDEATLVTLEQILKLSPQRPKLVALHHQPIEVGSHWIDKYPLIEAGGFLQLIDQYTSVRVVVWGHVHQVFERYRQGTLMLAAPSTVANSLAGTEKFSFDDQGPACRWLELGVDATVRHGIIRV